jgi:xanthine dehydrogenase accessory factor
MALVVIRGVGEVGSAVALALFDDGHQVALHDRPKPGHARRGAAFTDALYEGTAAIDGVFAKYAHSIQSLRYMLACGRAVAISDHAFDTVLNAVQPDVVVDARIRQHTQPEVLKGLAPLSIGLGPNFIAGETADLVIETAYGPNLGDLIRTGQAQAQSAEPREVGRHRSERFVYAMTDGTFRTNLNIGANVAAGQEVGTLNGSPLYVQLSGWLRGLAHDGADIEAGEKVIEVDASAFPDTVRVLGERSLRIAQGVRAALHDIAGGERDHLLRRRSIAKEPSANTQ